MENFKKKLIKICNLIFLFSLALALIIVLLGKGTEGKDYGPGAYYYSDIPNFEEIFYK